MPSLLRLRSQHIKTATKKEGPHLRSLFCIKRMRCCGTVALAGLRRYGTLPRRAACS